MTTPTITAPADHATAAAEQVRALNHATLRSLDGYEWPADVDATLASLQLLAHRLPQALDQARRWLTRAQVEGRIGIDATALTSTATDAVDRAVLLLAVAAETARELSTDLVLAREHTAHMTGLDDGDEASR